MDFQRRELQEGDFFRADNAVDDFFILILNYGIFIIEDILLLLWRFRIIFIATFFYY